MILIQGSGDNYCLQIEQKSLDDFNALSLVAYCSYCKTFQYQVSFSNTAFTVVHYQFLNWMPQA